MYDHLQRNLRYGTGGFCIPAGVGGGGGLRSLPLAVQDDIMIATIIIITNGFNSCLRLLFILFLKMNKKNHAINSGCLFTGFTALKFAVQKINTTIVEL